MKIILAILLLIICNTNIYSQDSNNSEIKNFQKEITDLKIKQDTILKNLADLNQHFKSLTDSKNVKNEISYFEKLLSFSPQFIFLIIFLFVWYRLKKGNFNLSDALTSDTPISITKVNIVEGIPGTPATATTPAIPAIAPVISSYSETFMDNAIDGKPVFTKSSSRFMAVFSAFTAIVISLSIISFNIYFYFRGSQMPDFKNSLEVLLGLGIGIIPYGISKFTEEAKK